VGVLAFGAVLALSFASYAPDKPELNSIGPVGYWLASLLVQAFGYAAYLFPVLLVAGSFALFVKTRARSRVGARRRSDRRALARCGDARAVPAGCAPDAGRRLGGGFLATLMREALGIAGLDDHMLAALGLLIWLMLTGTPVSEMVAHIVAYALHGLRSLGGAIGEGVRTGVERASGWRVTRRRRRAPRGASDRRQKTRPARRVRAEVEVEPRRAESIIEISAPPCRSRSRKKSKKEEKEQEEFIFQVDCEDYQLPPVRLLGKHDDNTEYADEKTLVAQSKVLEQKLGTFNVTGRVTAVRPGPVITTFEFEPEAGIKVSRVVTLCDDLTMALRATACASSRRFRARTSSASKCRTATARSSACAISSRATTSAPRSTGCRSRSDATRSATPFTPTSGACRTCSWPARPAPASRSASTRSS
jgi:S-DNA-T family DNA segregation ATPase FtsK/SpoIIIE